ncbi:MAG: aminoglycoside phosphotransferase family protein [Thermomicrobiales bacterium]
MNVPAIPIPPTFIEEIDRHHGAAGHTWLETLPATVRRVTTEWALTIDGPARHGARGIVVPVSRESMAHALKLTMPDDVTTAEIIGLQSWNGHGTVTLVAVDVHAAALLLERLDANRNLAALPIEEAICEAGRLIRRLSVPSQTSHRFPSTSDRAREIIASVPDTWARTGRPFPEARLRQICTLANTLVSSTAVGLTTWDFHAENVLWGERAGWTMIDPMPLIGDPEVALAPFLWNRADEIAGPDHVRRLLEGYVAAGDLDPVLTRAWLIVRLADYWLWGLGAGLTIDPERCHILLDWLDPEPSSIE